MKGKGYEPITKTTYEINNGEFKEYNKKGKLLCEGKYNYGQRYGKGIEYNEKGQIIFDGYFLNGKRWNGYCKENDKNNQSIYFEGQYLNGKKHGMEKEYYP